MGKRKFKRPSDSESEYEWEEAKPKKQKSPEIKTAKEDNLIDFIDRYSSKSLSQVRSDKKQEEKDRQTQQYEDRIYKPSQISTVKFDKQWLKKSYTRCQEQSRHEGISLIELLRDRYDNETVDFMIKSFGSSNFTNYSDKRGASSKESNHNNRIEREIPNSQVIEERYVTEADINDACASLIEAEMVGNTSKIAKLQQKVNTLREARRRNLKIRLTATKKKEDIDYHGKSDRNKSMKRGNESKSTTIENGFNSLINQERRIDASKNDLAFVRMAAACDRSGADDYFDREYDVSSASIEQKIGQSSKHKHGKLRHHKNENLQKSKSSVSSGNKNNRSCRLCYSDGLEKHLVISRGSFYCITIPADLGLAEFQCQLIPIDHTSNASHITDPDQWDELKRFKTQLIDFCRRQLDCEAVFMETARDLTKRPHGFIDCVPIPNRLDMSTPLFFKKAIDESKSEWCQNKGLLELRDGDIRRTVPRGFPYFSVEFGLDGNGYAVVIEDEQRFPAHFGREIVGSLLGKDLIEINDRKVRSFNQQADAVLKFEKKWKPYNLWIHSNSDDDDSD